MKQSLLILAALAAASPVLAHPGAHLHPHGETILPLLIGLTVVALAALFAWRAR